MEMVRIIRVSTMVRGKRQSTYRFRSSPFLLNPFLRPPNLRIDMKDVGCDRLSWINLRFRNGVLNDGFIPEALGVLTSIWVDGLCQDTPFGHFTYKGWTQPFYFLYDLKISDWKSRHSVPKATRANHSEIAFRESKDVSAQRIHYQVSWPIRWFL